MPGSYVDQAHPEGMISGSSRYLRGSGTSEATAITSGVVALLLQEYPDLSPDEVKRRLTDKAQHVPGGAPTQPKWPKLVSRAASRSHVQNR